MSGKNAQEPSENFAQTKSSPAQMFKLFEHLTVVDESPNLSTHCWFKQFDFLQTPGFPDPIGPTIHLQGLRIQLVATFIGWLAGSGTPLGATWLHGVMGGRRCPSEKRKKQFFERS